MFAITSLLALAILMANLVLFRLEIFTRTDQVVYAGAIFLIWIVAWTHFMSRRRK